MSRSLKPLTILIFAVLALILTSCGGSNDSDASPAKKKSEFVRYDGEDIKYLDGHLVCAGNEVIISSWSDTKYENRNYDAQLSKLLVRTVSFRAFGVAQSSGSEWVNDLRYQLEGIIDKMNPETAPYSAVSDAGTEIHTPGKCWVEDMNDEVLLGVRPAGITTTTISGPTVEATSPP